MVAFELPGRRLQGLADTQVKRLQNGELHVEAIQETEYEWHWFDLLLNETTWVNMTYSETINYNALIEVDAMSSVTVSGELKWAELDVMIFDGEIRYDEDLVLLCWFNEECPDDAYYARYKGAPRVTNAFGFNRTAVGGLRSPPLTRVVVGVRNHLVLEPITFSIRLLQLPRVIDGNFDVNSSLAPCAVRTDELANDDHRDVHGAGAAHRGVPPVLHRGHGRLRHPAGAPQADGQPHARQRREHRPGLRRRAVRRRAADDADAAAGGV